jgi:hypothetical protein
VRETSAATVVLVSVATPIGSQKWPPVMAHMAMPVRPGPVKFATIRVNQSLIRIRLPFGLPLGVHVIGTLSARPGSAGGQLAAPRLRQADANSLTIIRRT